MLPQMVSVFPGQLCCHLLSGFCAWLSVGCLWSIIYIIERSQESLEMAVGYKIFMYAMSCY